jgi:hypothetical protein
MAYRLLGMIVWKGAKLFLRRKYGSKVPSTRTLIAALAALVAAAVAVVLATRGGDAGSA